MGKRWAGEEVSWSKTTSPSIYVPMCKGEVGWG